jgi:hypothetical protein
MADATLVEDKEPTMPPPEPVQHPTVIITGRQKTIFIAHPTLPNKRVPHLDKTPMVITYPHGRRQLLAEASRLQGVLDENPGAMAEILKPGQAPGSGLKLSLPDWIKQAAGTPLPPDARAPNPPRGGELDDVVFPPQESAPDSAPAPAGELHDAPPKEVDPAAEPHVAHPEVVPPAASEIVDHTK